MYRILSIIAIVASLYWLISLLKANELTLDKVVNKFWSDFKNSFGKLKELKSNKLESNLFSSNVSSIYLHFYFF